MTKCAFSFAGRPLAKLAGDFGTAVEIWEAHKADVPVLTISTHINNWAVKLCSTKILPDINAFGKFIKSKEFRDKFLK